MTPQKLLSKAGLKTAAVGALSGSAAAWFLSVVLTVSKPLCVTGVVLLAVATAAYMTGWARRGQADGR